MQSDVLQILALSFAGLLYLLYRHGRKSYREIMTFVENAWIRAAMNLEPLKALRGSSYHRLLLTGVVVLVIGWGKILSICGAESVIRTVMNPSKAQVAKEQAECLKNQDAVKGKLDARFHRDARKLSPGPLNCFEAGMECPYRGHYFIDRDGFLSCDRHGRNSACPRLLQNQNRP